MGFFAPAYFVVAILFAITSGAQAQDQPTDEEIAARIEQLVEMADPRSPAERAADTIYQEKFADTLMIDALVVGVPGWTEITFTTEDFEAMAEHYVDTKIDIFSTTVTNGGEGAEPVLTRLAGTHDWIEANADQFMFVGKPTDLQAAKDAGKVGIILNSQSSDMLDGDLANVQKFYEAGIRQLNFTYNQDNMWSQGMIANAPDLEDKGLTAEGKKLVAEMNRVGMIIDCSHSSDQTCIEAARLTSKPMVMSHTNARALMNIDRNSVDAAIRAVASTGGTICINFLGGFLNPEGNARPKAIAKHIDYIKQLVGVQATCLGSDFVQNYGVALDPIIRNPAKYPPEQNYGAPTQMAFPGDAWGILPVLQEEHGWNDDDIRALISGNIMRVYEANWQ